MVWKPYHRVERIEVKLVKVFKLELNLGSNTVERLSL